MTLAVTIRNNGPTTMTIDSVSIDCYLPLAGKPRYLDVDPSAKAVLSAGRGPVGRNSLQPGQTIVVGIPVHVPDCVKRLLKLLGAAIVVFVMTGVLLANGAPSLEADIQYDAGRTVQSSP